MTSLKLQKKLGIGLAILGTEIEGDKNEYFK